MGLSDREQRMLAEIERSLYQEDPRLGAVFRPKERRPGGLVAGVAMTMGGLALLFVGVILPAAWVGVCGFALMVVGVYAAVSRRASSSSANGFTARKPRVAKDPAWGGFMSMVEERWRRRQAEDDGS